jgi:hypothetical protein
MATSQQAVKKRHYKDWYLYETRHTTVLEAWWMTVFTVVLVVGLPLGFAALFRYLVPWLFTLI